jgi:hypothetical protein
MSRLTPQQQAALNYALAALYNNMQAARNNIKSNEDRLRAPIMKQEKYAAAKTTYESRLADNKRRLADYENHSKALLELLQGAR